MTRRHTISIAVFSLFPGLLTAQQADLILTGGHVWTGDPANPRAEAVAVAGNRIAATGTSAAIARLRGPKTTVIELNGRMAMPGFNDAHIHFESGSQGLTEIDLTGVCTIPAMQKTIAGFGARNPNAKWLTGRGWEYVCFPGGKLPTKEIIDAVVKDRPVFLSAYDGHTGWANSAALKAAGITRDTKFTAFGEIGKDAQGEPNGVLLEGAQGLIRRLIPPKTPAEKRAAIDKGLALLASLGITSIQNASGDAASVELYSHLKRESKLTARTNVALSVGPAMTPADVDKLRSVAAPHKDALFKVGAVKFMLDGVIESHTAAVLDNYTDDPKATGSLAWKVDAYKSMIAAVDKAGFQIYTHAIGDRAVRTALDAYEHASEVNGKHDARYRVEHIEVIAKRDVPRFGQLGVLASMMPIHAYPPTIEVWARALGNERIQLGFAWKSIQDTGGKLVYSSDWPASVSLDPIRGLHNAVNRQSMDGKPKDGWIPAQRVTLDTALHGYTTSAAYASFEESIKGSLKPGMLADVVVLSADPFKMQPPQLHWLRVDNTIFDGRVIYSRAGTGEKQSK